MPDMSGKVPQKCQAKPREPGSQMRHSIPGGIYNETDRRRPITVGAVNIDPGSQRPFPGANISPSVGRRAAPGRSVNSYYRALVPKRGTQTERPTGHRTVT